MAATPLVSKQTRIAFREHLVGWTLRRIGDVFDAADVRRGEVQGNISGARRALVEEYYAGVDWTSPGDVRKVLRAFEDVLNHIESELRTGYVGDALQEHYRKDLQKFTTLLRRDGYVYENSRLLTAAGVDVRSVEVASQIVDRRTLHDHIQRIERSVDEDPAQAIGSAKELVETVAKLVLEQYGHASEYDTLQQLVKQTLRCLDLSIDNLPDTKKGGDSIRQVLSGLSQIVGGTAELRNLYGTGHGRSRTGGLQPRHARLVVGAATTLCRFLLETLDVRKS